MLGCKAIVRCLALLLVPLLAVSAVPLAPAGAFAPPAKPRPDLADMVAGTYYGDVISDARGSSQSDVTITVAKAGKNLVSVSSDYDRIPTVQIPLTRAMDAIIAARGNSVFLIELNKDPNQLSLTIDDASLSVAKQ